MTIAGKSSFSGTHYWRAWKAGQIYDGAAYEDYSSGSYADYDIAATDEGLGWFSGTVPNDAESWELVYQSGGSPSASDAVVWVGESVNVVKVAGQTASATETINFDKVNDISAGGGSSISVEQTEVSGN